MKEVFKWIGIVLGGLIVIIGLILIYFNYRGNQRLARRYDVDPIMVDILADSASLAKGSHWANSLCALCHGENLAGRLYSEAPGFGKFYSSNLTRGKGGVGSYYTDKDWIRAIRHGVTPDGRALFTMPSSDFNNMSAEDLGSIIGYLKTLPPVDNEQPPMEVQIVAKVLLTLGQLDGIISAEVIDHSKPLPENPSPEMAVQFGDYLVKTFGCRTCHGKELNGMQPPMPGAPFAPNLTSGGNVSKWSSDLFIRTLQSGITPEGRNLDKKFMPISVFSKLTEGELAAVHQYLLSLPASTSTP